MAHRRSLKDFKEVCSMLDKQIDDVAEQLDQAGWHQRNVILQDGWTRSEAYQGPQDRIDQIYQTAVQLGKSAAKAIEKVHEDYGPLSEIEGSELDRLRKRLDEMGIKMEDEDWD